MPPKLSELLGPVAVCSLEALRDRRCAFVEGIEGAGWRELL